jgi:pyruvate ferredoxin oxidoreductase gamma subunit/2-oxoisovalerate ferredoxin oxidoreductase gamma subunit
MKNIRFHGRGGQGAVTAGQILASAAFKEDQYVQSFSNFGMERRGAPVTAFTRVDNQPITTRAFIQEPDMLVILDPSMLNFKNTLMGFRKGGQIVINSGRTQQEICATLEDKSTFVCPVNATEISVRIFGQTSIPFTNVVMVGAIAGATDLVRIESVLEVVPEYFKKKVAEMNKTAALLGYQDAKEALRRMAHETI